MQVSEQQLLRPQERVLVGYRLLYFDDHLRVGEDVTVTRDDLRPTPTILIVGKAASGAGAGLDQHSMAVADELAGARWGHRHPVLPILNLRRHPDDHARS